MVEALDALPLPNLSVQVNNRKQIQGFYRGLGIDDVTDAIRVIDKLDKLPAEEVATMLVERVGTTPEQAQRIVNAIEAAGSLDAGKVRDALAKTNFDSLYGHVAFNDKGQISLPQIMIQIQNDQVVEIYAGGKFANKLVYPLPAWDKR